MESAGDLGGAGKASPETERGTPLLVIVGPTAVGKTALAVATARRLGGEVVSADSRYIYRGMDVGTAKPTPAERGGIPHHLIDVVDPDQDYSLARYQADARAAIADVQARGGRPILAGGTGLYVRAVTRGFRIPRGEPDRALRAALEEIARERGAMALYDDLAAVDPVAAARIDPRNVRRVIRAIEVYRLTGRRFSEQQEETPPPWRSLTIGLTLPREELYRRIDRRYEEMIAAGWADEVRVLLARGYREDLPSMTSLGYRDIARYQRGELSEDEALQRIKFQGHRYARQQYNWFRLDEPTIHWYEPGPATDEAVARLAAERLR